MMSQWHFLVTSTDTNHNIDLKVRRRSHLPWGSRVSMFCRTQLFLSTLLLPCYWPTYHVLNISTHKFDLKMRKYLHKFSMVCSLLIPACVCHFPAVLTKKIVHKTQWQQCRWQQQWYIYDLTICLPVRLLFLPSANNDVIFNLQLWFALVLF